MKIWILICTVLIFLILGCASTTEKKGLSCNDSRTLLDGVCVREIIADYVSCVRAQGATLNSSKRSSLSAEVGYLGIKASGVSELSDGLEKKYSASDNATMEIIQRCDKLVGINIHTDQLKNSKNITLPNESVIFPRDLNDTSQSEDGFNDQTRLIFSNQVKSCKDAKDKQIPNNIGNMGNGIYTINISETSTIRNFRVYCDMSSDGGGWTLVFRHDIGGGYFSASGEVFNINQETPSLSTKKYSILNKLNYFKNNNKFKFRLNWPGYVEKNIWYQESNPNEDVDVSGYQKISVTSTSNFWGGLELGNGSHGPANDVNSYIDGSTNSNHWYYAIGLYNEWRGGLPASDIISRRSGVSKVELWVQ